MTSTAAQSLGQLGFEDAIPALIKAASDIDTDVRLKAVEAISKLGVTEDTD